MNRSVKIGVACEGYSSNLGDRLIYESMKSLLKLNGVDYELIEISCRSENDNKNERRASKNIFKEIIKSSNKLISLFFIFKWFSSDFFKTRREWRGINKLDGVIIGGGQLLTDTYMYFPFRLFYLYIVMRLNNIPYAIVGCGVGESVNFVARAIFRALLINASYVGVRDELSKEYLASYVPDKEINVHPDVVFSFVGSNDFPVCGKTVDERKVLVNVQEYLDFRSFLKGFERVDQSGYVQLWVDVIRYFVNSGYVVDLVNTGSHADYEVSLRVYEKCLEVGIDKSTLNIADRVSDTTALFDSFKSGKYLLSTRMHAGIVGYIMGMTVMPIVWDKKVTGVWATADENIHPIDGNLLLDFEGFCEEISKTISSSITERDTNPGLIVFDNMEKCLNSLLKKVNAR